MIGPFRSEQGNSSHETVIDVAVTDEKVILLTDEEGAIEYCNNNRQKKSIVLPVKSVLAECRERSTAISSP